MHPKHVDKPTLLLAGTTNILDFLYQCPKRCKGEHAPAWLPLVHFGKGSLMAQGKMQKMLSSIPNITRTMDQLMCASLFPRPCLVQYSMCVFMFITWSRLNITGMVDGAACGQLVGENIVSLSPFAPEIWSRETGSSVQSPRVSLLILHNQAESGAYSRALILPPVSRDSVHLYSQPCVSSEFNGLRDCMCSSPEWSSR